MRKKYTILSWLDMGLLIIIVFILISVSSHLDAQELGAKYDQGTPGEDVTESFGSSYSSSSGYERKNTMSVPYFRSTIPMRIYECLQAFSTLRCTKLFVLQKMEERKNWINTGNITKDFINQFFDDNDRLGSLVSDRFLKMPDSELNKKLVLNFQRFFKNRDIKMRLLSGLLVKVVPSKENKLKFSLKKKTRRHHEGRAHESSGLVNSVLKDNGLVDSSLEAHENTSLDEEDLDGKSKIKGSKKKPKREKGSYKTTILQMAVPVMIMPAILMGTFLPFILPVLKMATLTTMIMNNTAFMAALIYAARQHVNAQDEQHINYSYGGHPGSYH